MPRKKPDAPPSPEVIPIQLTKTGRPTCGSCYFWEREDGSDDGECFYDPPKVIEVDEEGFTQMRPQVSANERACGRFKPAQ